MNTKQFRQKILDLAIRGKLIPQDPNDEPASVLLERIRAEHEAPIKPGQTTPQMLSPRRCSAGYTAAARWNGGC